LERRAVAAAGSFPLPGPVVEVPRPAPVVGLALWAAVIPTLLATRKETASPNANIRNAVMPHLRVGEMALLLMVILARFFAER